MSGRYACADRVKISFCVSITSWVPCKLMGSDHRSGYASHCDLCRGDHTETLSTHGRVRPGKKSTHPEPDGIALWRCRHGPGFNLRTKRTNLLPVWRHGPEC